MSNLAVKRINADIKNIKRSKLDEDNIYVWLNDENIFNMKILIIGPKIENSPYQNGFYFFNMNIPKDYPLSPPEVKFITTDGRIRFNPNLYSNGKVCLSILNTWSGPGWTSASTLTMVLLSLQSILHEYPIQNEPGYETENGEKSLKYNIVLAYHNINRGVIDMINNPPNGYEVFKNIMKDYFIKNYKLYKDFLAKYKKYQGLKKSSGIYKMNINNYNIQKLEDKLNIIYFDYLLFD